MCKTTSKRNVRLSASAEAKRFYAAIAAYKLALSNAHESARRCPSGRPSDAAIAAVIATTIEAQRAARAYSLKLPTDHPDCRKATNEAQYLAGMIEHYRDANLIAA